MLPPEALNKGVTITLKAIHPAKNGAKDQLLCCVPLSKNAGKCQIPHIIPSIMAAQKGANFL